MDRNPAQEAGRIGPTSAFGELRQAGCTPPPGLHTGQGRWHEHDYPFGIRHRLHPVLGGLFYSTALSG
jgi:hypothetical protein